MKRHLATIAVLLPYLCIFIPLIYLFTSMASEATWKQWVLFAAIVIGGIGLGVLQVLGDRWLDEHREDK